MRKYLKGDKLMARPKGINTTPVCFSLHKETVDNLNKYSKESMIPKTKIIERALSDYFEKVGFIPTDTSNKRL